MGSIKEIKNLSPADSISIDDQKVAVVKDEETWPRDWRAYVALFGGFLLMFNSWYIPSPSRRLVQGTDPETTGA